MAERVDLGLRTGYRFAPRLAAANDLVRHRVIVDELLLHGLVESAPQDAELVVLGLPAPALGLGPVADHVPLQIRERELTELGDDLVEDDSLVDGAGGGLQVLLLTAPPIGEETLDGNRRAGLVAEQRYALRFREGGRVVEGAFFDRVQDGGAMALGPLQVSGGGLELDLLAATLPLIGEGDLDGRGADGADTGAGLSTHW